MMGEAPPRCPQCDSEHNLEWCDFTVEVGEKAFGAACAGCGFHIAGTDEAMIRSAVAVLARWRKETEPRKAGER